MSFRNLCIAILFVSLATPAFAQGPPPTTSPFPQHRGFGMMRGMLSDQEIDRSVATLQRTLNLSETQVTGIRQLAQSRRDSLRSVREEATPKFVALMALLKQPNPDPTAVGRIVVDLSGIHQQVRAKQMDYEKQFDSLLNPTQRQAVNNLRNQAQTFMALRRLGVITPEFPQEMFTRGLNPPASEGDDATY